MKPSSRGATREMVRVVGAALLALGCGGAGPEYVARNPDLRRQPVYLYPAAAGFERPRAFLFFFGNDVGFWDAHRALALDLAGDGYAVAGVDVRPLLDSLPAGRAARDSTFAARIAALIHVSRAELGADSVPLLLGGHSLGAELAVWAGARVAIPGLRGVLALSPRGRGHLAVRLTDLANVDPSGPMSFSVAAMAGALPPHVRIALVRGDNDRLQSADATILAGGGARIQRYRVLFAGHSLKRLIVARPVVRRALLWLLAAP